jgi:hypothetical protein
MLNPRAFRWTALAERWASEGERIDVVTSWRPGEPIEETRNGVAVHRVGWRWIERLRGLVARRREAVSRDRAGAPLTRAPSFAAGVAHFISDRVWRRVYWPDAGCLWYRPARAKTFELLAEGHCCVLISVAPSFTAVLVGASAKRGHPSVRWVLDLGDPFSFLVEAPPNNLALYRGLNSRVERRAFAAAEAVSVTNEAVRARYAALFPESAGKIRVVPPLLSAELGAPTRSRADGTLRLLYVGTLYPGVREPDFLLELFAGLAPGPRQRLELHFVGDVAGCAASFERYRPRLGDRLVVHGLADRAEAVRAMQAADILVNIGNETVFQLPSKIIEYVATGKPIVNLARGREDSSMQFLTSYSSVLNLVVSGRAPSAAQRAEFEGFLARARPQLDRSEVEAFVRPYRIESISAQYRSLLGDRPGSGSAVPE